MTPEAEADPPSSAPDPERPLGGELPHPARTARWGPWRAQPSKGPARRLKLLLLHGFAGAPGEMRPLGKAMLGRRFRVHAPLLPGHGENLDGMREIRLDDWLEAATLSYEGLRRDGSPVAIVGFCLGGALALRLAGSLNPRAICCLSTPVRPLPEGAFPLVDPELRSTANSVLDSPSAEVRRWRELGSHKLVPLSFHAQYQNLLRELEGSLDEVRCPLLVAQSRGDGITPPEDAEILVEAVRSERRKLVWSRHAGHALPVDVGRRALFAELASFLEAEDQAASSPFSSRQATPTE